MAKNNGNNTVTVERGDTLSEIAQDFLGSWRKYQELAKINNIPNPNRISIGQVIKLSGTAGSGGSSSSSTNKNTNTVTITNFGELSTNEGTLYATWTWSKWQQTASYEIEWTYDLGNGIWFIDSNSTSVNENNEAASRQATYNIPSGAKKVRLRIKPISKKETKNNKETTHFTGAWSGYKTYTDSTPVETPPTPSVKIEKFKLTAELDGLTIDANKIEFQIYKDDKTVFKTSPKVTITATKSASWSCDVTAGGEYKVRCRAYNGSDVSEWSAFSSGESTIPSAPKGITSIKATSETSVYLEWGKVSTAKTYEIEYTTEERYFDGSDQTTTKSGIENNHFEITGLQSGDQYFFRVRATNTEGSSEWSKSVSISIGKKPSAPTTWSSTTTAIVGEPLILYWVHNAVDGSSQTYAELELTIDGALQSPTITIKNTEDEDEKDKTSSYPIDTNTFTYTDASGKLQKLSAGAKIQWRVRTAGITKEYGDWSVQRTVDVYAPPTLSVNVTDIDSNVIETLTSFPFYVYALAGPNTQTPIGYHVSITANEAYETTDQIGNPMNVNQNGEVYSKYFDITDSLLVEFTPGNIDLENGITYTVTCVVTMNSGLTAEATTTFSVAWTDERYVPNAEITYDSEKYVTHIRPYCENHETIYRTVTETSGLYSVATDELDESTIVSAYTNTDELVYLGKNSSGAKMYYCIAYTDGNGNAIDPVYYRVTYSSGVYTRSSRINSSSVTTATTQTGEEVQLGVASDGSQLLYCATDKATLIEDVKLSVYRRGYDGGFTEIMTGIDNIKQTWITDPHPALDYARYRIVVISDITGAVGYYDVPGYPINEVGIIIQWDEEWSTFDSTGDAELANPPWSGSLLRLPYNIDVSDNNSPDVTLVNYIGRKRPVSYYGTHLGEKATWNTSIPKSDKETLYALRRLALWMGDVYVREPSGSGYWANINVSFSQKHKDVTIPVTLSLTRVEGGV